MRALAAEIAANAPLTLRATKEMVRRVLAKRRLAAGEDADIVEMCYTSHDFREGVTAFLAKRKPVWSGDVEQHEHGSTEAQEVTKIGNTKTTAKTLASATRTLRLIFFAASSLIFVLSCVLRSFAHRGRKSRPRRAP